jgi:hypothetical protein
VVSIEMMEHAKNYDALLARVSSWLKPGGRMFVHIFTHASLPFHYVEGWMAENFFTGGQMPSDDLLLYFQRDLRIVDHWVVDGRHYERTCNAWLAAMDANKGPAMAAVRATYGEHQATKWFVNWRLFFIACAELFGFKHGSEWAVSHYLFEKPGAAGAGTGAAAAGAAPRSAAPTPARSTSVSRAGSSPHAAHNGTTAAAAPTPRSAARAPRSGRSGSRSRRR